MSDELYKKYRPKSFREVLGQGSVIKTLTDLGRRKALPHTILFAGPSGTGKTTLARILCTKLKCSEHDVQELNCADFRGIDMVREIRNRMGSSGLGGVNRAWIIDEAHRLTADAQNAFLKILEDTPDHVWFILCTTEPEKLKKTIRTRSTELKLKSLNSKDMERLLDGVAGKEGIELTEEVRDRIVQVADGGPRKALVLLNQIMGLGDEEEQLAAVGAGDATAQGIELARALLNPRSRWPAVASLLKKIDEEPEQLRWMVLGYMKSVLLGGGKLASRAFDVITIFGDNFYDSKQAGLVAACYEVIEGRK